MIFPVNTDHIKTTSVCTSASITEAKKGVAVDMRSEEGKNVVMDLVSKVDIVIENFKSGTLEKLGDRL